MTVKNSHHASVPFRFFPSAAKETLFYAHRRDRGRVCRFGLWSLLL